MEGKHGLIPPHLEQKETVIFSEKEMIGRYKEVLQRFCAERKIRSLDDRLNRGLNPAAMLAIEETREPIQRLADHFGALYEEEDPVKGKEKKSLMKMTLDIQGDGPWHYADALAKAEDPEVKTWMIMAAAESIGNPKEGLLGPGEFLTDLDDVRRFLLLAEKQPELFFEIARQHVLEESKKKYREEGGVPITEHEEGFTPMATGGHEAGVWQDKDGMVYVGAKNIDESLFAGWPMKRELRDEPERGRKDVIYYVNQLGETLFKLIYGGFAVVLSRNIELAKGIVRALQEQKAGNPPSTPPAEAFGLILYEPSSAKGAEKAKGWERFDYLRHKDSGELPANTHEKGLVRTVDAFYNGFRRTKEPVIYFDMLDHALEEKKKKVGEKMAKLEKKLADAQGRYTGKGQTPKAKQEIDTMDRQLAEMKENPAELTDDEKEKIRAKLEKKVEQKTEELRYMLESIGPEMERLPEKVASIMDMAGGAGDLGLAVAAHRLSKGLSLKDIRIIDPFIKQESLDMFGKLMIEAMPFREELREKFKPENKTLQEAEISADAAVVAKHPCGDLTDSIITKWIDSKSPLLVIMTCCQDKAADKIAPYGIDQADWTAWCKESAMTNTVLPDSSDPKYAKEKEKLERGKAAMLKLDNARVKYLRDQGFDAELRTTNQFPKGDVIIARRLKPERVYRSTRQGTKQKAPVYDV